VSMHSLCAIPQVYNKCHNIKLYKVGKIGCKLDGSCKIISLLKMYNGKVKILSCKIKLLK
jgi:hypothetical protein